MDNIKRGDIFWADLGTPTGAVHGGVRPVVIVQNNIYNKFSRAVIVAPLTSQPVRIRIPMHVKISAIDCGLQRDSTILLEQLKILDKEFLKERIGKITKTELLMEMDKALCFTLGINIQVLAELNRDKFDEKPLVITEGKTDVQLIEIAWKKLHPNEEMFFDCEPSGIEPEIDKRTGNATCVQRTIEFMANTLPRPIIGLFDNDGEGNIRFNGLRSEAFEIYDMDNSLRKHKNSPCWGMLLPVPDERKLFVTEDDIIQRYFVIEHYFSDEILKDNRMYGKNILGTSVFNIKGGTDKKDAFSKNVEKLDAKEFEKFEILFTKIKDVFKNK